MIACVVATVTTLYFDVMSKRYLQLLLHLLKQ